MKRKLYATLPDGREISRWTERTYTHIIAIRQAGGNPDIWIAATWCGRPDLAQKQQMDFARKTWVLETQICEVRETR